MSNSIEKGYWESSIKEVPFATMIGLCGTDLSFVTANEAFYRLLDTTPADFRRRCGNHIGAMMDEASFLRLTAVVKSFGSAKKPCAPENFSLQLTCCNEPLWVFCAPACIEQGGKSFLYCTLFDITAWKSQNLMEKGYLASGRFALTEAGVDAFAYDPEQRLACVYCAHTVLGDEFAGQNKVCRNFVQKVIQDARIPESFQEIFLNAFDVMETQEKYVCEFQMLSADRQTIWVRMTLQEKPTAQGGRYLVGIFENITARRNTAQNYLNETRLYQSVLNDHDAHGQLNITEDRITKVGGLWRLYNEVIDKITYSELIDQFIRKVVHTDDRKFYSEFMSRENFLNSYKNGIDKLTCDFRRIAEQNKMVWMQVKVYLSPDPVTGHLLGLLFVKNIDRAKKAEIQASTPHQTLSQPDTPVVPFEGFLAEHGDIAYLVDPSTYQLLCGNRAMYDRLGLTAEQCKSMKCYEAMHKRTSPCPFCGNASWSTDKFFMWKNLNMALEQEFLIKNKLVTWQGREVLLALAIDISNNKSVVDSLDNGTMESHSILAGVQHISEAASLAEMMYFALETAGCFFRAESVFFWQKNLKTGNYFCAHSWSSKNGEIIISCDIDDIVTKWITEQRWDTSIFFESPEAMLYQSYEMYQAMITHSIRNQCWYCILADGEVQGYICVNNASGNFQNTGFMSSFSIFIGNELKKRSLVEQLRDAANRDSLTDLLSRYSFDLFVNAYSADHYSSLGIIVANIDNLKRVNNVRGFSVGNLYLCQFADMLRAIFPPEYIYRMNGDEFLIILPEIGRAELVHSIHRLEQMVEEGEHFAVSVGNAWDDIEKDIREMIDQATSVMKANKKHHYDSAPASDDAERRKMLSDLIASIKNREYEVFLQPKINLDTNALIGAEALTRFRSKKLGIVPPAQFIGVLEKNNLIRYIDLFVFEESCRLLEKWKSMGVSPLPVISLNFSRVTLLERDILISVETIIKNYDVPRENLEIEITESAATMGKSVLYQTVSDLYNAGFLISLDDFGTKYTNLSILADIDFSVLKIDRSLVNKLESSTSYRVVLQNIIRMCEEMNIEVIAEGIETFAQEQVLKAIGCKYGQGYLYGKPIPADEFEEKYIQNAAAAMKYC